MANDFVTFAGDPAANVMTQAQYIAASFVPRTHGFTVGTAVSLQLNKVWRQSSLIAHMIGQFTVDNAAGTNMIDDGSPAGLNLLETNFKTAIHNVAVAAVPALNYLPLAGGTLTGDLRVNAANISLHPATGDGWLTIDRSAGSNANIQSETKGATRWIMVPGNSDAEQGNNSGSNFAIKRYSDAAALLDTPLSINRASGVVNFSHPPTVNGAQLGYLPLGGGTLTGPLTIGGVAQGVQLRINAAHGENAAINLSRYKGYIAGIVAYGEDGITGRWNMQLANSDAETGNNAGSNFQLTRYSDAGLIIDTPIKISRATGIVDFRYMPTVNGVAMAYLPIAGGTLTGALGVGGTGITYPTLGGIWGSHHTAFGWDGTYVHMAVDGTDVGDIATKAYVDNALSGVSAGIGGYLPLHGGTLTGALLVNAQVTVNGTLFVQGTTIFGNRADFGNFVGISNSIEYRYRQWSSNWYDVWQGSDGLRAWAAPGAWVMTLNGIGNLYAKGVFRADGARILSQNTGLPATTVPTVTAYNVAGGICTGFWTATDGMWFGSLDGNGNPLTSWMHLSTAQQLSVFNGVAVYGANGLYVDTNAYIKAGLCVDFIDAHSGIWIGTDATGQNPTIQLSGGSAVFNGEVDVYGTIYSRNGRVLSVSNGNPAFTAWNPSEGFAMGFWIDNANGTEWRQYFGFFDGAGYPDPNGVRMFLAEGRFVSNVPIFGPSGPVSRQDALDARALVEEDGKVYVDTTALIADLYRRIKILEAKAAA